jgi:hypothetical protein
MMLIFWIATCLLAVTSVQPKPLVTTATLPAGDLMNAYSTWEHRHPALLARGTLKIAMPYLDVYSPSGNLLYHTDNPEKAAEFLRRLPRGIPRKPLGVEHPSLRAAIEMVPEFRAEEGSLLSGHVVTVFAVTYPGWDRARPQNDAVETLRRRAGQIGVRVLEVDVQL